MGHLSYIFHCELACMGLTFQPTLTINVVHLSCLLSDLLCFYLYAVHAYLNSNTTIFYQYFNYQYSSFILYIRFRIIKNTLWKLVPNQPVLAVLLICSERKVLICYERKVLLAGG
jgi:hypothetical protein